MMSNSGEKKFKIFIYSVDGVGHINSCVGIGQALARRGHEIHFVTTPMFAGQFRKFDFKEIVLVSEEKTKMMEKSNAEDAKIHPLKIMESMVEKFKESGIFSKKNSLEKLKSMMKENEEDNFMSKNFNEVNEINPKLEEIIEKEQPDFIIVDQFMIPPCIAYGKIPWAFLFSGNPTFLFKSEELPPSTSGYPSNDRTNWAEFREVLENTFAKVVRNYQNKLNQNYGYPEVDPDQFLFISKFMNIYGYPEELDYQDVIRLPENYVRLDAFCRDEPGSFELPDDFQKKIQPGEKLIYVSLGSIGSIDVDVMKSLVEELKSSPHKYIFSKGAMGEKYELADNMWGLPFLPQTKILPLVDLVVTHGGNNTVTETFSFGKPMLVMPLFADQFDNAQRITEKGYGLRMNPYDFQAGEVRKTIDQILNDDAMLERCRRAGERMANSKSKEKACLKIEQMLKSFLK